MPPTDASREAFVLEHTALEPVPMVPEIRLYTATELVPLWRATESWLADRGLAVPFWSVPWAGGQGLARYVLDHPEVVRGKRVLDFGTGSGLVAIAAAIAGASAVRAVDVDPLAAAACALNVAANGRGDGDGDGGGEAAEAMKRIAIAIVEDDDLDRLDPPDVDVIVAGDVWYERGPSARFAAGFGALAARGVRILTGDPGRAYVPAAVRELARYDVPTTVELESAAHRVVRVLEMLEMLATPATKRPRR